MVVKALANCLDTMLFGILSIAFFGKGDGEILTERVFRNTKLTGHRDIFIPGLDPKADLKELVSKKVLQTDSPVLQMPELEPFELRRT